MKWLTWAWVAAGVRTLAAIPLTTTAIALVVILWRGGWPVETSEARIQWLGIALVSNIALLGLALFLTSRGIRTFSFKAGPVEASVNGDGEPDADSVPASVEITEVKG